MPRMNAYSEDLRKKIIEALRWGTTKTETAHAFGVSRSSVKRYAKMAEAGRPLAPKKRPGSKPKIDERARRLLEADAQERPSATLSERCEYLQMAAGVRESDSTVSRKLRRLGWSRKKIPTLRPGQVAVMDNLSSHKGGRVREIVEGAGCGLIYLPPYSPGFNPIEQAFSKVKGLMRRAEARTRESLIEAMGRALTAQDARGFFGNCGYREVVQPL